MARLAIDTSSPLTSVAIEQAGSVYLREDASKGSHSKSLAQLVEDVRSDSGLESISEIEQIVIGIGPGSFTGLRIGLAFAKGLSLMRDIPITTIPSFRAIARATNATGGVVGVISDARRGEYFFSSYAMADKTVQDEFSIGMYDVDHIRRYLDQVPAPLVVIDAGCETFPPLPVASSFVSRVAAGLLALEPVEFAHTISEISLLEPLYVREVSALTIEDRRRLGML